LRIEVQPAQTRLMG